MQEKIRLAILGATGMAGREALLHQQFLDREGQYAEITCVTASLKSVERSLGEVFDERESKLADAYDFWELRSCPETLRNLVIEPADAAIIASKADYAISAVDSDVAEYLEPDLTKLGVHVFSNCSRFRWSSDVPLLIPEVNYEHIHMVEKQAGPGVHVCNPNCTTAGYVPLIRALEDYGYTIRNITLVTQQALSGKGDAIADINYAEKVRGNVIDDWTKDGYNPEEWKSAYEPMKILGRVKTEQEVVEEREKILRGEPTKLIPIYTQTTRVATQFGHLEHLSIEFSEAVSAEKIKEELSKYSPPEEVNALPTTPNELFIILDRMPEPKTDVNLKNGMAVVVGDVQQHSPSRISLWTLTNNLRRGATWAGRQGLELYLKTYKNI